jgi:excinuclease UvrABC nuclease subunit
MSQRLYRFLNPDGNLLYIGRTENIKRRIHSQHFDKKPMPCLAFGGYEEVHKIKCTNEMSDLEAFFIGS